MIQTAAALLCFFVAPLRSDEPAAIVDSAPEPLSTLADGRRRWRYAGKPLFGGDRSLLATGMLPPHGSPAPWVVIASDPNAPPARYERWIEALSSRGYGALLVERQSDEPWWRYAEATANLIRLLRIDATTPGHVAYGELDAPSVALLADGVGAAAAVRAVAEIDGIAGVLLLDPEGPTTALPWLSRVEAPIATVASGLAREASARSWHGAGCGSDDARWWVGIKSEVGIARADGPPTPALERDVRELCTAFIESVLPRGSEPRRGFTTTARSGAIDRTVECTATSARVVLSDDPARE